MDAVLDAKRETQSTREMRDTWVQPTLLGVLASVLVLFRLGTNGLRGDEAFSISTSLRSWPDLLKLTYEAETNGALYAWFLKGWSTFGTSEVWLRIPSAAAFVATVAFTWALGRRLHGQATGAISATLVALHGSVLQFGQTIRFYSPVVALGLGFIILVHRSIEMPSPRRLFCVCVVAIALPLMHLVAATLIVAAAVVFLVDEGLTRPHPVPISALRRLCVLLPGLFVASAVGLLVASHDEGQSINLPLGRDSLAEVVIVLSGSGGRFGVVGYVLLLVAGLAMLRSSVRHRTQQGGRTIDVLVPWIVMAITGICVVLGSLVTPVMAGRYVLFLAPFVAMSAAIGIVSVTRAVDTSADHASRRLGGMTLPAASPQPWGAQRLVTVGVLCLTVLVGGAGAANGAVQWIVDPQRDDWRPLGKSLLERARPDDGVLFANDSTRLYVEYQLRRNPRFRATAASPVFPSQPWGTFRTGDQRYEAFSAAQVQAALAAHRRVWLVVEGPLVEEPFTDLPAILSARRPIDTRMFGRTGILYLLQSDRIDPNSSK